MIHHMGVGDDLSGPETQLCRYSKAPVPPSVVLERPLCLAPNPPKSTNQ